MLEEFGAALYGGPYLASAVLAATALLASPDEGARRGLLPDIASGQTVATLAFTEDGGSWDPAAIRLSAVKDGEAWRLDGHKSFVLDGATAGLILVVAATDAGLSLFAVEGDAAGLSRAALPALDQTRQLARLEFAGVTGRLIGSPGDGAAALDRALDVAAIALAAEQLGGAQRALDMAVEYAKIRRQFDRPIGSFQAIKHRCADLLLEVESLRSAVGYAAAAVAEDSAGDPGAGLAGQGVRLGDLLPRGRGEHPDPRRHRLHLGARRPPVLQAGQGQRAVPRRRRLPPGTAGQPDRPVGVEL